MRYSPFAARKAEKAGSKVASNEKFFADVAREVGVSALHGSVVLLGGRSSRSLAIRRAQAPLRFDRRSSYWSHAALIVRFGDEPGESVGVEATLDPEDRAKQVPERNGVTPFSLSRYFDEQKYPNIALMVVGFEARSAAKGESSLPTPSERRRAALAAALQPNRNRERYPFWDGLAIWSRYATSPHSTPNPLLEGVPLPAAALCEYAYEAAGLDLTPGVTGNNNCPEILYATAKHWAAGLGQSQAAVVRMFSLVRDEHEIPEPSLSADIDEISAPSESELGGKRRRGSKRR
jgi:hypothetical protein